MNDYVIAEWGESTGRQIIMRVRHRQDHVRIGVIVDWTTGREMADRAEGAAGNGTGLAPRHLQDVRGGHVRMHPCMFPGSRPPVSDRTVVPQHVSGPFSSVFTNA